MQITINNYRCFPDPKRVRLDVRPGFIAFLGTNNAGKSSLLRFFYEFQDLFVSATADSRLTQAFKGSQPFNYQGLRHPEEVFSNHNEQGIEIEILTSTSPKFGLRFTVPRAQNVYSAAFIESENLIRDDPRTPC
jgi:AAA15 family ATPase/GTPase